MTVSTLHDIADYLDNAEVDFDDYDDLPEQSETLTYYDVRSEAYVTVSL